MSENKIPNQLAFCGLYCPKCAKTKIADSAEILLDELKSAKEKDVNILDQHSSLEDTLNKLMNIRCQKFCRDGGGNPDCEIRKCCQKQGIGGCWECLEFSECPELSEQFIQNISKIKELGIDKYIEEY